MLIDALLVYTKDEHTKSKYVLHSLSNDYEPFMILGKKIKQIPLYVSPARSIIKGDHERAPALSLSGAGGHYLTGLFLPCPNRSHIAYGDFSQDALLVIMTGNNLDLIACKGKKAVANNLFTLYTDKDSEFITEIEEHKKNLKEWKVF